jgi:hypothetical protein
MAKEEASGGRDFTVVTMGIHGEKWKRKKNIEKGEEGRREGTEAGPEAAGNEKGGRRKENK